MLYGVQQAARQRADAGGAADGQLDRIPDDPQHGHDAVEGLLAAAGLCLFLRSIVAVQGVQTAQIVLILPVILRVGVVVILPFLLQLGVVI